MKSKCVQQAPVRLGRACAGVVQPALVCSSHGTPRRATHARAQGRDDSDAGSYMTPDEEAAYNEHLARRRAEREQALQEALRKAKAKAESRNKAAQSPPPSTPASKQQTAFSQRASKPPNAPPPPPQPATPTAQQAPPPSTSQPRTPQQAQPQAPAPPSSIAPPAARPSAPAAPATNVSNPTTAAATAPSSSSTAPTPSDTAVPGTKSGAGARAAAPSTRRPLALTRGGRRISGANARAQRRRGGGGSAAPTPPSQDLTNAFIDPTDSDTIDADTLNELDALAAELLGTTNGTGELHLEDASSSQAKTLSGATGGPVKGPVQGKGAGAAGAAVKGSGFGVGVGARSAGERKARAAADEAKLLEQLRQLMADEDSDDENNPRELEDLVNMDDIDWDVLEQYEQMEKAIDLDSDLLTALGQAEPPPQPSPTTKPPTPRRTLYPPSTPAPTPTPTQGRSPASVVASAATDTPDTQEIESLLAMIEDLGLDETLQGEGLVQTGQQQGPGTQGAQAGTVSTQGPGAERTQGGASVSAESVSSGKGVMQGSGGISGSVSGSSKGGAAKVDWDLVEKMFLGEGWQQRELGPLKAELEALAAAERDAIDSVSLAGGLSGTTLPTGSATGTQAAISGGVVGGDSESPSWLDEVTSLLLGLVLMSAKRHMKTDLLPETVAEESRAEAVWSAPWCLVVVDDTPECRLEYANQRALQLLRLSSFDDIYDYTLYDFIGGDDKSLQEWAWAQAECEDEDNNRHALIRHLQLTPLQQQPTGPQASTTAKAQSQSGGVSVKDVKVFYVDSLGEEGSAPVGTALVFDC